jgi:hypothetical protein
MHELSFGGPGNMALERKRTVAFVWNGLSSHMVVSVRNLLISEHHLLVSGVISSGESPTSCVFGSGIYKCEFRNVAFEFYVRYCEPIGFEQWLFYLDHERNRQGGPPGLGN